MRVLQKRKTRRTRTRDTIEHPREIEQVDVDDIERVGMRTVNRTRRTTIRDQNQKTKMTKMTERNADTDVIDAVEPLKRTPGKKVPAAAQLQKAMDTAVDQLRSKFASESLADMLPKGKTVKAAARGAAAKRPVAKNR